MARPKKSARPQRGPEDLRQLSHELTEVGFEQAFVASKLALPPNATGAYLSMVQGLLLPRPDPGVLQSLPDALTGFFIGGAPLPHAVLERALSHTSLDLLLESDLARRDGQIWRPKAALVPVEGLYFSCDFLWRSLEEDYVFYPDASSAFLVTFLSRAPPGGSSMLDLGTGSGIVAIYCAARLGFDKVRCVEPNPRAVDFARRNAALNGVEAEWIQGDGGRLDRVKGEPVDLLTFNFPLMYSLPRSQAIGQTSRDGEKLLWDVLGGLEGRLTDRGQAVLYHQTPIPTEARFGPRATEVLKRQGLQARRVTVLELPSGLEYGVTCVMRARPGEPTFQRIVATAPMRLTDVERAMGRSPP